MSAEAMSSIAAPGGVFAFEFRMEQDTSRAPVPTSATLPRHLPTSCSALKQSWRMKLAVPTPPKPTASRNRRAYFSVCNDLFMWVCGNQEAIWKIWHVIKNCRQGRSGHCTGYRTGGRCTGYRILFLEEATPCIASASYTLVDSRV